MNKTTMTAMACLAAGSLFASVPVVSPDSVSMMQDSSRKVTITYRLSGEPGVVTIDIQTNYIDGAETKWASIGGKNLSHLYGDVNRLNKNITSDSHAYWRPDKSWKEGGMIADGGVRAVVTAWATNAPPDYMVVDLQLKNSQFFYVDADSIPGGVQDRQYKTTKMILRKVHAAGVIWRMGSFETETNRCRDKDWAVFEPARLVVLSEDYYLGIYEVTAGQWDAACYASGNTWARTAFDRTYTGADADVCPLAGPRYWVFRNEISKYRWPDDGHNAPDAYGMCSFRKATGLLFDFPTSAQWEFACRAGSESRFCYGEDADLTELGDYAWYSANSGGTVHEVGTRKPNVWGFYDMHGNVAEYCLEPAYYPSKENPQVPVVDPTIALGRTDTSIFAAGGACNEGDGYLRSSARLFTDNNKDRAPTYAGARLWLPASAEF